MYTWLKQIHINLKSVIWMPLKAAMTIQLQSRFNLYIYMYIYNFIDTYMYMNIYPVLWPKLTLIQPTWSAYPYHLVFLIWYPYSLVFLIWYPYAPTSLYGNTAHCSGYGVAMGCYGLLIVTRTAIVTSQWYDRYCFTEYARTWARHPTTPWQRECTVIIDRQSIDSLLDSMRSVTHFWEIPHIYWGAQL